MIPVLILCGLSILALGMTAALHGKPKTGEHNGWTYLVAVLLTFGLYWWAGLFDVFVRH